MINVGRRKEMSEAERDMVIALWKGGFKMAEIVEKSGVSLHLLRREAYSDQESFPERYFVNGCFKFRDDPAPEPPSKVAANAMSFTTSTGYVCTMPRVSILEKAG